MTNRRSAAIYTRISSDQDGTGLGVARQEKECRALAEGRGWDVVEVFTDNDQSAYTGKRRPAYERMLEAMREGRVNAVIVYHLDRLTRRPIELEAFVQVCDQARITDVATVSGDVNLSNGDGLLIARIGAAVAANESASKSRRLRSKWQQKAESGRPHGGSRPYGYKDDAITIDRREAKVIREVAERIIAGESLRSICTSLNERGERTTHGGPWRTIVLRDMITNPRMIGMRRHRGEIVGKAVWKPILTETQQAQVIARLDARKVTGRREPRSYLLSGMLRCGKCGHTLYASRRENSRRYVCLGGPDHEGCGRLTVVAEPLEDLIAQSVLLRLDTPELARALSGVGTSPQIDEIAAAVSEDQAQLEELAALYATKQITANEWVLARNPIQARIDAANRQIAGEVNATALIGLAGTGTELQSRWTTMSLGQQVAVVRALIDHIVITPGVSGARGLDPNRVRPQWLF
jgi:DNA invertase Pin-like site-specific DNA recombinase